MAGTEEHPVVELQRHLEVLDQAALALTRSLSIIVALAGRHGSPHQVEDARRLQELFARIDPLVPGLADFHERAQGLCFSLEHRLGLLGIGSPEPVAAGETPRT
ncbi:hypothetical protein ACFYOT_20165 [Saccharothrix saharensis]|uniref:hypothetical protein n=1 Tax=Saccharothrix saharensis TaxID=571190 RepID=UPI00368895BF